MFNWLRAICPVDPDVRTWIEQRMNWLVGQFGWEVFAQFEVVLPIQEHFPAPFDGSTEAIRELFDQVCEYMEIDPQAVDLKFYSERRDPFPNVGLVAEERDGTAGLYDRREAQTTIWLETSKLNDPTCVVATCAHELCHAHLLGGNRLSRDEADHEAVTDLATLCFGMGVFTANASLRDHTTHRGNWSWWNLSRQGYLTDPVLAYALALYAWAREEHRPQWGRYLRADIQALFRRALAYLESRDEDVIVVPKTGEPIMVGPCSPELVAKLFWKREAANEAECAETRAEHDAWHSPADDLFTQAVFLTAQGEWEKAIPLFSEVLREEPTDGEAYQQRSLALFALGDLRDSLADAEKAIEYLPDDSESYYVRGRAYLESRQYDAAAADFTRYLKEEDYSGANPGRIALVYYLRGAASSKLNDLSRAAADFSRAIRNCPEWADAYKARADVYERLGEFKKAQADREEVGRLSGKPE
jgi:tetratricopeptide (TPR) repeat protein